MLSNIFRAACPVLGLALGAQAVLLTADDLFASSIVQNAITSSQYSPYQINVFRNATIDYVASVGGTVDLDEDGLIAFAYSMAHLEAPPKPVDPSVDDEVANHGGNRTLRTRAASPGAAKVGQMFIELLLGQALGLFTGLFGANDPVTLSEQSIKAIADAVAGKVASAFLENDKADLEALRNMATRYTRHTYNDKADVDRDFASLNPMLTLVDQLLARLHKQSYGLASAVARQVAIGLWSVLAKEEIELNLILENLHANASGTQPDHTTSTRLRTKFRTRAGLLYTEMLAYKQMLDLMVINQKVLKRWQVSVGFHYPGPTDCKYGMGYDPVDCCYVDDFKYTVVAEEMILEWAHLRPPVWHVSRTTKTYGNCDAFQSCLSQFKSCMRSSLSLRDAAYPGILSSTTEQWRYYLLSERWYEAQQALKDMRDGLSPLPGDPEYARRERQ